MKSEPSHQHTRIELQQPNHHSSASQTPTCITRHHDTTPLCHGMQQKRLIQSDNKSHNNHSFECLLTQLIQGAIMCNNYWKDCCNHCSYRTGYSVIIIIIVIITMFGRWQKDRCKYGSVENYVKKLPQKVSFYFTQTTSIQVAWAKRAKAAIRVHVQIFRVQQLWTQTISAAAILATRYNM